MNKYSKLYHNKNSKLHHYKIAGNWNKLLLHGCKIGNKSYIDLALGNGANKLNQGLKNISRNGNIPLVLYIIENGAIDWNLGLQGACDGKHEEIIEFMIKMGATDRNLPLKYACKSGDTTIISLITKDMKNEKEYIEYAFKGACEAGLYENVKNVLFSTVNKLSLDCKNKIVLCLQEACISGNIKLVELVLSRANIYFRHVFDTSDDSKQIKSFKSINNLENIDYQTYLNKSLCLAYRLGHLEIAEILRTYGALDNVNTFRQACISNNIKYVSSRLNQCRNICDDPSENKSSYFKWGLYEAFKYNKLTILDTLIEYINRYIGTNKTVNIKCLIEYWNHALRGACYGGYLNMILLALRKGANDFNGGLIEACSAGNYNIAKWMIIKGASNIDSGLKHAMKNGHLYIVKYICNKWKDNIADSININDLNEELKSIDAHTDTIKYVLDLFLNKSTGKLHNKIKSTISGDETDQYHNS